MRYSPERLRAAREARGFSREHVGRGIDRTAATIYRYETGLIRPTVDVLGSLADFYDVPIGELYDPDPAVAAGAR